MNIRALTSAALLTFLYSGCATMIHGDTEKIRVDSNPRGCAVVLDGNTLGVTPCTIELSRRAPGYAVRYGYGYRRFQSAYFLTLMHDGYAPQPVTIREVPSAAPLLNCLLLPFWPVGLAIDASDGAVNDLVPDRLMVNMVPGRPMQNAPGQMNGGQWMPAPRSSMPGASPDSTPPPTDAPTLVPPAPPSQPPMPPAKPQATPAQQ